MKDYKGNMDFIKKLANGIFIFIGIILLFPMYAQESSKSINYVGFVNQVTNAFIEEVRKEFGLQCIAEGGSMPYDIFDIDLCFTAYRKATIDEARELIVTLIEKFLKIINAHEKIRPYLREYPFPAKRVGISISFHKKNNRPETENSIDYVHQCKNKLFYTFHDSKIDYSSIALWEESYEDAYQLVQNSHSRESLTADKMLIEKIKLDFIQEVQKKYGCTYIGSGAVMPFDICFTVNKNASLDEARELEVLLTEKLLNMIHSHEKIHPSLNKYPLTSDQVHISLLFYNKTPKIKDCITQVVHIENKIYYLLFIPPRRSTEIAKESYEDTYKIVQNSKSKNETDYQKYVNEITQAFCKEVDKEFGFTCVGFKGNAPFQISFIADKTTSVEEARIYEIALIEKLLKIINDHEKIRPYLREYPFTMDSMCISIFFRNDKIEAKRDIDRVSQIKNELVYSNYDRGKRAYREIAKEGFDEAHRNQYTQEVVDTFIAEVRKEYGLIRFASSQKPDPFEIELYSQKPASLDRARELEVLITEKLLKIINSHEKLRPYLREYPSTIDQVHITIDFGGGDKCVIGRVFQRNRVIHYNIYGDAGKSYQEISQESYEDALKTIQDKLLGNPTSI